MQAVLLIGLQASGKSTFYQERFFSTHVRVSLDLLKTRHRQQRLVELWLDTRQPYVVDNTNPTRLERRPYIERAKASGFRVVGYYLQSRVEDCKRRNDARPIPQQIPLPGLLGTYARLEVPALDEGFDELYYVEIDNRAGFVVKDWSDEIRRA
jgi:predicted kinase